MNADRIACAVASDEAEAGIALADDRAVAFISESTPTDDGATEPNRTTSPPRCERALTQAGTMSADRPGRPDRG